LHSDKSDQRPPAALPNHADDALGPNATIGFVVSMQANFYLCAQHRASSRVIGKCVNASESVGGDGGANPLKGIAVIVVTRRLDHHKME
jgi:hypothetical protein